MRSSTLVSLLFLTACSADESLNTSSEESELTGDPHIASFVSYDPTTSKLPASNVQSALDVLAARPSVGPAGPIGPVGPVGPQGVQGPVGPQGEQGVAGVSVTSEQLFPGDHCPEGGTRLDSASGTTYVCNGAVGATGALGPQGPQGEQGPIGATGAVGPRGPQGEKGDRGEAGPAGASEVHLAPPNWVVFSEGRFLGLQWTVSSPTGPSTVRLWSSEPGTFVIRSLFDVPSVVGRKLAAGFGPHGAALLAFQPAAAQPNIQVIRLDGEHGGDLDVALTVPTSIDVVAQAGVNAAGEPGGYRPGLNQLFGIRDNGDLVAFQSGGPSLTTLITYAALRSANAVAINSCFASKDTLRNPLEQLLHDPTTKRILIADTCNDLLWVLGYEVANGPVTFHAALRLPEPGVLAYDPARKILWSGPHGLSIDLAAL